MTKVVGYSSEEDFRRAANVIRYIERGGIDHPYYRRQVPMGEEGCDCCDELYSVDLITETIRWPTPGQGSPQNGPAQLQLNVRDWKDTPYRLWYRPNAANGGVNQSYYSDQFTIQIGGVDKTVHWDLTTGAGLNIELNLYNDSDKNTSTVTSTLMKYQPMSPSGVSWWDVLSDNKLWINGRKTFADDDLNTLPPTVCVKVVSTELDDLPMTIALGGSVPSSLTVKKNTSTVATLTRYASGLIDSYDNGSVHPTGTYALRAVYDADGAVVPDKAYIEIYPSTTQRFATMFEIDVTRPLHATFTDASSNVFEFIE